MIMDSKTITCKNGNEYRIVSIGPENAKQFLDFMHQVSSDTHFMSRYGDEIKEDSKAIEGEQSRLKNLYEDDRQGMMSIFDGDKIIGNIAVRCVGVSRKTSHRCSIGLGVRKEYHGLGLGTILMEHAINFAREAGYKCMELGVLADNVPASSMYKKMGFVECGRIPDAFRLDGGESIDEITMYREL